VSLTVFLHTQSRPTGWYSVWRSDPSCGHLDQNALRVRIGLWGGACRACRDGQEKEHSVSHVICSLPRCRPCVL
jgi:hypothetical protein